MSKIIKISENLLDLLEKIKSSSAVANLILESSKEGNNLPIIENGVDYLSISEADSNKISYLNCDRINTIEEGSYWISGKRYHILPGKIISKLFDKSIMNVITNKDIEIFSNVYRSCQVENKVKFEIVKGDKIKYYYSQNSYNRNEYGDMCGSLGGSCMKHDRCQNYFSIYTNNKEVSLLCLLDKSSNYLIGRALLWEIESENLNSEKSSYKIMDRIYTTNDDFYTNLFKNWAKENGYYHKSEQNFSNTVWFEKDGKKIDLYLSINLNTNYKYFPYLDTFKFIDLDNSRLFNYPVEGNNSLKILNSTEGGMNKGSDFCFDEITRIIYHIGDTIQLGYLNNIRVYQGNVNHSYIYDCYILKNHAEYDSELDDYIFNKDYENLNDRNKISKVLEERRKREEENNKKRSIFESVRSDTNIYNSIGGESISYRYRVTEENMNQPSVEQTDIQSEGRVTRDNNTETNLEDYFTELIREEIRPRRRVPSSARRPSTIISPGIYATERDQNNIEENISEEVHSNENESSTTVQLGGSLFNRIWSGVSSRIYPDLSHQMIEEMLQSNASDNSTNDETSNGDI